MMKRRFHFADASWFRIPLKLVVVAVAALAFVALQPALAHGTPDDQRRALFGIVVLLGFVATASVFIVAVNDSYVDLDGRSLYLRFEGFFSVTIPVDDVVGVRPVDPRPRWRYRFGLGTNYADRISCSHGGDLIEIELARPCRARLWPRHLQVRRFWLALRERDEFVAELRRLATPPPAHSLAA